MTTLASIPVHQVFNSDQRFSILIHALSKKGKSTLSSTAPMPILVLDAEGSWRFIPVRKRHWDPTVEGPPIYDGTWDVCIVTVQQWQTVELVYRWITQTPHVFVSVVIDSITEIQRRCKMNLRGIEALRTQDWGTLLSVMDKVIRDFRDLTLVHSSSVRCVIFISETKQNVERKYYPYMQGQISDSLPYFVDICGFLYPDYETDANGQATEEVRRLWIGPNPPPPAPQFESGERVGGRLGYVQTIRKPPIGKVGTDITDWMKTIFSITDNVSESV